MLKYTVRHAEFVEAVFKPIVVTAPVLPRVGETLQFTGQRTELHVNAVSHLLDKPALDGSTCFAIIVWVS